MSADNGKEGGSFGNDWQLGKSKFAILAGSNEEIERNLDLESLKQKIQNLLGGPTPDGHETVQIKLEKEKAAKGEPNRIKHKKDNEA